MEIGLREWLIIGGAVVVLLIILDGWRRMKGSRSRLRMDIEPQPVDLPEETDSFNPELPNGGARVVGDLCTDALDTVSKEAKAESQSEADSIKSDSSPSTVVLEAEVSAIDENVANSVAAVTETSEGLRTEPTFDLPVQEERIEPVFDLSSFEDIEKETVVEHNCPSASPVQPVSKKSESSVTPSTAAPIEQVVDTPSSVELAVAPEVVDSTEVPEPITAEPHQATVVEEEIMTSAALFEAIEQSRQQRSAAVMEQSLEEIESPLESPAVEQAQKNIATPPPIAITEESSVDSVDEVVDVEPSLETDLSTVRKPDPLMRPLPELESVALAEPEPVLESDRPIELSQGPISDDPLLDGVEETDDLEEPLSVEGLVAEPERSLPSESPLVMEDDAEPRFIQDIQAEFEPAQHSQLSSTPEAQRPIQEPPLGADIEVELELPPEFASPIVEPPVEDVVLGPPEPLERAETVVAFPEQKPRTKDTVVAEQVESEQGKDEKDQKAKAGSLRQPPNPENVLVMTVIANHTEGFNGEVLKKLVLACGMRYGDMDIFHRFEDGIDSGAVQFSMANATGTGTFDINNMSAVQTRAVSFFMSMEEPREVLNAFECMLATAETVARHLEGELVDENRIVMRPQTQEHYRQRVRDFEMRNLRRRSG